MLAAASQRLHAFSLTSLYGVGVVGCGGVSDEVEKRDAASFLTRTVATRLSATR